MDDFAPEQDALLAQYYLAKKDERDTESKWSADGPSSISPFVPCASSRIPYILRSARLTADDVLWDLGCGDGRVLHWAAAQFGCRTVGVDIDAPCIVEAQQRAREQGVEKLCQFATCDLMALPPGSLRPDGDNKGNADLGGACGGAEADADFPSPTCAILFVTSHALSRLREWLHGEWVRGGLRIITCVERLDDCFDFEAEDPLFGDEVSGEAAAKADWPIYNHFERAGVYVVPPHGTSVDEWARLEAEWTPTAPLSPEEADLSAPAIVRGVLSDEDIVQLIKLGDACAEAEAASNSSSTGDAEAMMASFDLFAEGASSEADTLSAAEDLMHQAAEHRVVHLHRGGQIQASLPRLLDRILAAIRAADADRWRLLVGRPVSIRSAELHTYRAGGGVTDPHHRDAGSLLTLSILLTERERYEGAAFSFPAGGGARGSEAEENEKVEKAALVVDDLHRGDGVVFVSEKRHNVSTLLSGERQSFVLELWEGKANAHNRHK